MSAYLARRVAYAVLTFFGITIVTFTLIHSVPGDPVTFYIGQSGTHGVPPAILQAIRHGCHLDEPLLAQYGWWLRGVLTLDFGPRSSITVRRWIASSRSSRTRSS